MQARRGVNDSSVLELTEQEWVSPSGQQLLYWDMGTGDMEVPNLLPSATMWDSRWRSVTEGCGHALWRDAIAHHFVSWRICQLTSSSLQDKLNLALLISRSLKPHWCLVLFLVVSINKYVLSGKSVMYLFKVRLTDSFISRSSASIHHCIRNCKPIFSTSIMILFLPFQPPICQISLILSKLSFLK